MLSAEGYGPWFVLVFAWFGLWVVAAGKIGRRGGGFFVAALRVWEGGGALSGVFLSWPARC